MTYFKATIVSKYLSSKKYYMVRILITVCLLFSMALFSHCKKELGLNTAAISGMWELSQAQSSLLPPITYTPGNGNTYKFANNSYEKFENNVLVKSGNFILMEDSTAEETVGLVLPAGKYTTRIIFDDNITAEKTFLQIEGNNLIFISGYFPLDGGSNYSYQRIN